MNAEPGRGFFTSLEVVERISISRHTGRRLLRMAELEAEFVGVRIG